MKKTMKKPNILLAALMLAFTAATAWAQIPNMVIDANTTTSQHANPSLATHVGNILYYVATDGINGRELWRSDGTVAGTYMVKDIYPGSQSSNISSLTNISGVLYFSADGGTGQEFWRSDGTNAGTYLVIEISPGLNGIGAQASTSPSKFTQVGATTFFIANKDGTSLGGSIAGAQLWKTDGTTAGTVKVLEITLGITTDFYHSLVNFGGTLYFLVGTSTLQLWKSDGTVIPPMLGAVYSGTEPVYNIGASSNITNIDVVGSQMFFWGNNGTDGSEMWKSDGTATGTVMIKDINPTGSSRPATMSPILNFADVSQYYFVANDGVNGDELWKTDGTAAGTVLVKDIVPGAGSSDVRNFAKNGAYLYFTATDGSGNELWKTDGSSAGTVMVKDINTTTGSAPASLVSHNGSLLFSADDGINGRELWKSDGTTAGTVMVYDILTGGSSNPGSLLNIPGTPDILYFAATDAFGTELWTLNLLCSAGTTDWHTTGNTANTGDFIGTLNAEPFNIKTNNLQRMTIDVTGKMGLGTSAPSGAALHLLTGTTAGMLPPVFKLERNDATNQAGLLSVGISSSGFASGLLGGGSAYFKIEDPFGNSPNRDMGFSTNGTAAQLVIKNSGYVGIGTETPTANFHSIGTARLEALPASTTNTDIVTTDASGNLAVRSAASLLPASTAWDLAGNLTTGSEWIGTQTAFPFIMKTMATERARFTPTGEMGIGTTTPTAQLEVSALPSGGNRGIIGLGKNTGVFGEAYDMNGPLTDAGIAGFATISHEAIGVHGKGTYLTTGGNGNIYGVVGTAGATNPLNNVGVFGEAHNANGYNSGVIGLSRSTTGVYNSGVIGQVELNTAAIWNRAINGHAPVAPNHYAGYFDGNVDMQSGVVRIGNVNTPIGYKLYVEKGILTERVKVAIASSAAWADYVFEKDYKLKTLPEIEAYVKEYKHLPSITSAKQLEKEGLDLGEMQSLQMAKIEELTLYMIEMKKEIEALKKENKRLKVNVSPAKN
jgi:ELWxxDGT repeat protein